MDKIPLTIEMPILEGETAAHLQTFFYTLIDAFDAQYCHTIERYYQNCAQQPLNNSPRNGLTDNQEPF